MTPRSRPALAGCALATPLAIACAVAILALHAALLPEGHWQGDEFICAAFARDGHLRYLWFARIDGWSPRPFSELPFYAYVRLATVLRQPLTVPFLALLWSMLIASTMITLRRGPAVSLRVLIGLATSCMFLLGHPVGEMFYWPAGAVAYLSTLSATALALFLLADGRVASRAGACALSASLTVCAASSEAGACAAVPLACAFALAPAFRRRALIAIPALLMSGFVFWTLAHHRMQTGVSHAMSIGDGWHSLLPTASVMLAELWTSLSSKLLFFLGLRWCWTLAAPAATDQIRCIRLAASGFAVALLAGAAATILAAFYQFGAPCCERHATLRQGWIALALVALALASTRWPAGPRLARLGPVVLLAACLTGFAPRLPSLVGDLRLIPQTVSVNRANWAAGRDPARQTMVYRLPPRPAIAGATEIPPGHWDEPASTAWWAHGLMSFFGKRRITIPAP